MRWVLVWLFPVVAQAAVPSTVSDGLANALIDAASLGGIVLGVYGGLRGVKFLRDTLNAPLEYESRQDRADTIRRLRADGWTNSEIRNQARGEH